MIRTQNKQGIEGMYLNIIKTINDRLIANNLLNVEMWKHFLWSQEEKGVQSFHCYIKTVLEFLTRTLRSEK
jgi:hypothetical protein